MELRKDYEAIRAKADERLMESISLKDARDIVRRMAEDCQELADRPMKELTDAEIQAISDKVEFAKFADDILFARSCIAAFLKKQREPETVKFRAARRKDNGRVDMLRADFELSDWEWLPGKPQEFEVKLP